MDWRDKSKFYHLNNFRNNLFQKDCFGISIFDCDQAIIDACNFFDMPAPMNVVNGSYSANGFTCFIDRNPESYFDDILMYSLRELREIGIDCKYAFSLIMTHECGHRLLQNITLPGVNDGEWEEELCCDYFMGVRTGVEGMLSNDIVDKICGGLGSTPGSKTHPSGDLRAEVFKYGCYAVGSMDLIHHCRHNTQYYFEKFINWLGSNHIRIQTIQQRYLR